MMVFVYGIFDRFSKEIYVGMTNNLERRIAEHKRGQSEYTRKFKNIVLIYREEVANYKEGRKREKFLKNGCGKEFLKEKINQAGIV